MSAAKRDPQGNPADRSIPEEIEKITRNLNGIKTFHRMQANLIDEIEQLIDGLRERFRRKRP